MVSWPANSTRLRLASRKRRPNTSIRISAGLADELVHPGLVEGAFAGLVDVEAVVVTGQLTVEAHGEADLGAGARRRGDEVEVARLETERDRAGGGAEEGGLLPDRPIAGQRPVV